MDAGRINKSQLRILGVFDPEQAVPCGLRFGADDRQLFTQQLIEERGLAHIGPTQDRNKASTESGGVTG